MPYVDLPGVHLWYNDTGGTGVPVVFMHAASGTCESWGYQLPVFTAAGYRCIPYDRRNWGRSRPDLTGEGGTLNCAPSAVADAGNGPEGPAPTQSRQQPGSVSDDLHGLVNYLGLDRFHVVATAAGGIGGLDYAVEHPDLVRSLVVANSIGGVQDPAYLAVQHRLRPPEIQQLPIELRELGPSYRGTNPAGTHRWIEIERSSRPEGIQGPGQQPRLPMTFARLETIRVPVLVLVGDADLLSPPALMRMLATHIPNCQFATVPEAGHAAFWEQPELWNRLVLEFLGQH